MLAKLIMLFAGVPFIEMLILIKLGEVIGFWPTMWLVIITGILGASLARHQGLRVFQEIQRELAEGHVPAAQMIDGLLVLIGGIVLLTPGLITDLIGFSLLIPMVRGWIRTLLQKRFSEMTVSGTATTEVYARVIESDDENTGGTR